MMLFYFLSSITALLTLLIVEHPWLMPYYGICFVFATSCVLLAYCVRPQRSLNSSYPQSQDLTADKSSSHKNQLKNQDKANTHQLKQNLTLQTKDKRQDDHMEDVMAAITRSEARTRMEQKRLKTVDEMDSNRVSLCIDLYDQMSEDSKDAHSMENTLRLLPDCSVYDTQGVIATFFQAPNGRWNGAREKKGEEQEYNETEIRLIEKKEVARLEKVRKDDAKKTKLIRKTLIPGCDPKAIAHLGDELLPSKAAFSLSQEAKKIL